MITETLKAMNIGDEVKFPIEKSDSLNTIMWRLKLKGYYFSRKTVDEFVEITRKK